MSELNDDALQAMISKIEALFRHANDPAATEPERQAFQAKALALMAKHRIASIETDTLDDKPDHHQFGALKGTYAKSNQIIIQSIAAAYGCRVYGIPSGRPGDPTRIAVIYGFKADTDRVAMLARLFIEDARTQALRLRSNDPNTTIRMRNSYVLGYAAGVSDRFKEAQRLLDQDEAVREHSKSTDLVFVSRAEQVHRSFTAEMSGQLRKAKTKARFDRDSYNQGRVDGKNSNVGRSRLGGSGRALTSG